MDFSYCAGFPAQTCMVTFKEHQSKLPNIDKFINVHNSYLMNIKIYLNMLAKSTDSPAFLPVINTNG